MKKAAAIAATLLVSVVVLPSVVLGVPPEDIRAYCASIHESYQIRLVCERQEKAAKDRLYRQVGLPYGIPQDIWNYCARIHSSWQIVEVCARRELQAKGLLERR